MPDLCSLIPPAERRPEMPVIDCNVCGATVKAANDEELARELSRHMQEDHSDVEWSDEQASELVANHAYHATDS
jgi:predicted small metal-binding protein